MLEKKLTFLSGVQISWIWHEKYKVTCCEPERHWSNSFFPLKTQTTSNFWINSFTSVQKKFCYALFCPIRFLWPASTSSLVCSWANVSPLLCKLDMFKQNYKDIMLNIMALYWCFWKEEVIFIYKQSSPEFLSDLARPQTDLMHLSYLLKCLLQVLKSSIQIYLKDRWNTSITFCYKNKWS